MNILACMIGSLVIILGLGGLAILAIVGMTSLINQYGSRDKRKE